MCNCNIERVRSNGSNRSLGCAPTGANLTGVVSSNEVTIISVMPSLNLTGNPVALSSQ